MAEQFGADIPSQLTPPLSGIGALFDSRPGDITFCEDKNALSEAGVTRASLCFVPLETNLQPGAEETLFVPVQQPREVFLDLANKHIQPIFETGTDRRPTVHPSATIASTASIATGAVIGPRTRIGPCAVIGPGVQIGHDCNIGANASIYFALLGNHISVLAGARVGEAGFGLTQTAIGLRDIPHFGRVILQDHVTFGANSCIDRGMLGDTVVGEGSKIDNHCHIGHNTVIGRNVVMAAFAGISGSVTVGDGVQMGGRVGIVDHVMIGEGASLAADAAVFKSVPPGETWAGSPARPLKQWQRETVWLRRRTMDKGQKS